MKILQHYEYLGKCIQKVRPPEMSQDALSKNICCKFTLSRIENGHVFSKKQLYTHLLDRLGFYYEYNVDYFIIHSFLKTVYHLVEYQQLDELTKMLVSMKCILTRNLHNIIFVDYQILYVCLHTHYIEKKKIIADPLIFNTLCFHDEQYYTLLVHTYGENLIRDHSLTEFHDFYAPLPKQKGNILLDFLYAFMLQMDGQALAVVDLYNTHKEALQVECKTYQLMRFLCIVSIGHIEYEPDKAIRNFKTIQHVHRKQPFKTNYLYIIAFGYACIYIKQKKYLKAFRALHNCINVYPQMMHYALPYLIFLSFLIDVEIDQQLLIYTHSPLGNACIDYYYYRNSQVSSTKKIQYLAKHIIPLLTNHRMSDPFIMILRAEEQYQFGIHACNMTAMQFYIKLKETCKEVSLL